MHSTASFIAIFSVWIAGIAIVLYLLLPSISASRTFVQSYDNTSKDASLRKEMYIGDKSYISFTPLGIFDILNN